MDLAIRMASVSLTYRVNVRGQSRRRSLWPPRPPLSPPPVGLEDESVLLRWLEPGGRV